MLLLSGSDPTLKDAHGRQGRYVWPKENYLFACKI
jgi:hypothetical protein